MQKEPKDIAVIGELDRFRIGQVGDSLNRDRWTILTVLYVPELSCPWVGQVRHKTVLANENTRSNRFAAEDLDTVMDWFQDSDLKHELQVVCDMWMVENMDMIRRLEQIHGRD